MNGIRAHFDRWSALIEQVRGDYLRAHGRAPALFRPRRFTEKMQWRKLFELRPDYAILSDKLAVRGFVAARAGEALLIPLLWSGPDPATMPLDRLSPPYVLKSSHAAGQVWVVHTDADIDPARMRETAAGWLAHCHGTAMCEPAYVPVPRQLMIERMLFGPGGEPPVEYKLFTFGGRVRVILCLAVEDDRIARKAAFYTPDWRRLAWRMTKVAVQETDRPAPPRLADMISLAERLGGGTPHLRVDLYDCDDGIRVGELTLYTWSGHEPYQPASVDFELGAFWPLRFAALRAAFAIASTRHPVQPRS
jgi:hypothetical protein